MINQVCFKTVEISVIPRLFDLHPERMINRILLNIAEILLKECSNNEKYVYFCAGKKEIGIYEEEYFSRPIKIDPLQ